MELFVMGKEMEWGWGVAVKVRRACVGQGGFNGVEGVRIPNDKEEETNRKKERRWGLFSERNGIKTLKKKN